MPYSLRMPGVLQAAACTVSILNNENKCHNLSIVHNRTRIDRLRHSQPHFMQCRRPDLQSPCSSWSQFLREVRFLNRPASGISSSSRREHRYSPKTIVTPAATTCTSHQSHLLGNSCTTQKPKRVIKTSIVCVSVFFRPKTAAARTRTYQIETVNEKVDKIERHAKVQTLFCPLDKEHETQSTRKQAAIPRA